MNPLAVEISQAIGGSETASKYHCLFPGCLNLFSILENISCHLTVSLRKIIHGVMDSREIISFCFQFSCMLCSDGNQQRVKLLPQIADLQVFANFDAGFEFNPFLGHLINAALDVDFIEFEIRNAIDQQTSEAVIFFKNRYLMSHPSQLLRCRQSCGSGSDHGNFFPGFLLWRLGLNPAFLPSAFGNVLFDLLDGDGMFFLYFFFGIEGVVFVQHAGVFTGCGADTSGEFRKIIGTV